MSAAPVEVPISEGSTPAPAPVAPAANTPAPATPSPAEQAGFPPLKAATPPGATETKPSAPAPGQSAGAWYDSLSSDERAYISAKGWDKEGKGPADILEADKSGFLAADAADLRRLAVHCAGNLEKLRSLRKGALERSKAYTAERIIESLLEDINLSC